MPEYKIGGQRVRRKNWWMPCVIGPKFKEADEEEQARLLKATYWADNASNAEWPALLGDDDCSPSAKSRLKKKAAGWLILLARMERLNPKLFAEVVQRADDTYSEQLEHRSFPLEVLRLLTELDGKAGEGEIVTMKAWLEEADDG